MRKPDPYDFEPRIVDLLGESGRFENWTGTVRFHVDGQNIGASFFPDCKGFTQAIEFATAAHYVLLSSDSSTMSQNTLLEFLMRGVMMAMIKKPGTTSSRSTSHISARSRQPPK